MSDNNITSVLEFNLCCVVVTLPLARIGRNKLGSLGVALHHTIERSQTHPSG